MPQTDTQSLQQIKRQTEQTRAGLTDTVEQLRTSVAETASDIRQRISPDAIKAEVSDYIKSRGERLMNDVTAAARRNPMQAVAVGASVAYPLLRLARTIPLPVLMVGAGLFFAGSKTGQSATRTAGETASDISDEVGRRTRDFGNQVGESASASKAYASDQLDRASAAVSGGADQVSRAADAAGATLASNSQKVQEKAVSFGASLSGTKAPVQPVRPPRRSRTLRPAQHPSVRGRSAPPQMRGWMLQGRSVTKDPIVPNARERRSSRRSNKIHCWWRASACWSAV